MRNQSEGFTDTANFQNWDTLTVAYHPLTGIAVAFSHRGRNVLEMAKFKGGNIWERKNQL
jgi:hypothetical protein